MGRRRSGGWAALATVALTLVASAGAEAATVVNGNFESGDLSGWSVRRETGVGNWYSYKGTNPPIGGKQLTAPVPAPPQGAYAAISDEANPDTVILYQDVALRPGYDHRLSLFAYYTSLDPIAVPSPDTLSASDEILAGRANQQYRIDVIRPTAPIDSVDPADILRTVFRTRSGDPRELSPTLLTADLSPFAGQTVRLRIANAAHEETFNAGVDAVAVESAPPGQLPPLKQGGDGKGGAAKLGFGKAKANSRNGTAILPVRVPGPGRLSARTKKGPKLIKAVSATAAKAGTVKLSLRPTNTARGTLELKQKLRVQVAVNYAPSGGKPQTATVPVVLKLEAGQRQRR